MNIHEIARKTGIGLSRLRQLEKLGVLKVDASDPIAEQIRLSLWRQSRLSVAHLIALLDNPDLIDELGSVAVQKRAQDQIAALGDLSQAQPAPQVPASIREAHQGVPIAIRTLRRYVEEFAPAKPVGFHWFAVRIARAAPEAMRDQVIASLNTAFAKLRAVEEFEGWWIKRPNGQIFYHNPGIKHDL